MFRTENPLYKEDLEYSLSLPLPWEQLNKKTLFITGATGTIGTYLIDVLMLLAVKKNIICKVIAMARTKKRFEERFSQYLKNDNLVFLCHDVNSSFSDIIGLKCDYVFHFASNTHPVSYAKEPISTILTNVLGLNNLLEFASKSGTKRFIYASSVEIYGENRGDVEKFTEDYCGYIDCNTMRAGYPEGKRTGEALCQAYIAEKELDIVIPRLSRIYGATMLETDSKVASQFIKNAVNGEDIVLKSDGKQFYSYTYIVDAINAVLYCLFFGKKGEAYNISASDIHLCDMAQLLSEIANTSVKRMNPDKIEKAGFSKTSIAIMDSSKLKTIGFKFHYSLKEGLERTISCLKNIGGEK
jgi:nucleoside-diphosphate-sugar epimerase